MPRSRDCPSRPKHKRYESDHTSDSDSDSDSSEEEEYCRHNLDPVVLTPEEEEDFRCRYLPRQPSPLLSSQASMLVDFSSEGSLTPSPPRETDGEDDPAQCTETEPAHFTRSTTKAPKPVYSYQKMVEYLTTTGKEQADLLATCNWDIKVYDIFNVERCIVHPDYFFASKNFPHLTVSTILAKLDKLKLRKRNKHSRLVGFYSWRSVKKRLRFFFDLYEGFENLADVFHLDDTALSLKVAFDRRIDDALDEDKNHRHIGSYQVLKHLTQTLVQNEGSHRESTFLQYVEALIQQLNTITNNRIPIISVELELVMPAKKSRPMKKVVVKPDIVVLGRKPKIMLVGEVKPFGHKGVKYIEHKGRKVQQVQPDVSSLRPTPQTELATDQSQGQGDQLPPTVNEKERSVPSLTTDKPCASTSRDPGQPRGQGDQLSPTVNEKEKSVPSLTTDQPHASTSREQTESSTKSETPITIPSRSLDEKEEYKVDKCLPQLFGQMLAAMQTTDTSIERAYQFCHKYENVQFGFAVEGFKLRFVKLTMIDLMKKEKPAVSALLSGKRFKCHISMTQEFNLLKRHHLEMFYQVLLAMHNLCW